MNVLITLSNLSYKSGVTSVIMNYLRHVNHNNNHFSIIYYDSPKTITYENELIDLGVDLFFFPRRFFARKLKKFCKHNYGKYDIVHINDPYLSFCFINIKKRLGVKKVIYHSHSPKFSDNPLKGFRNYFLSLPSRISGDSYFACSYTAGTSIFGKVFKKRGIVVYNAIDTSKYRFDLQKRQSIRAMHDIDDKTIVIGHIGNMIHQKNHMFLLDVFNAYLKLNNNANLLLLGDGPLRKKIERKINLLGISKKVIFGGIVSNVGDYLSAMDMFVFPSFHEGLGIVAVEAQTNGLPILCSDRVPAEAIITDTAYLLSLKDSSKEWALRLDELLKKRNNSIVNDERYDISKASSKLESIYQEILNG